MTTILHNVKITAPVSTIPTSNITTGQVYTSTSTNAIWAAGTNSLNPILTISPDKAALDVTGRMVINGVDLEERLKTIEKVLMIPERDVILEKKHPKLKKLYNDYINTLEKYRTFEAIKGDDDAT